MDNNGFQEYKQLFLHMVDVMHEMEKKVNDMHAEIKLLKYKSSIWGAVAGGAILLITALSKKVIALF